MDITGAAETVSGLVAGICEFIVHSALSYLNRLTIIMLNVGLWKDFSLWSSVVTSVTGIKIEADRFCNLTREQYSRH